MNRGKTDGTEDPTKVKRRNLSLYKASGGSVSALSAAGQAPPVATLTPRGSPDRLELGSGRKPFGPGVPSLPISSKLSLVLRSGHFNKYATHS